MCDVWPGNKHNAELSVRQQLQVPPQVTAGGSGSLSCLSAPGTRSCQGCSVQWVGEEPLSSSGVSRRVQG